MASESLRSVALTGASGLIGSALTRQLRDEGIPVSRLVRREARGADEISWDPATGRIDAARLEGIDAVIHLAAENLSGLFWTAEYKARIRDSRVNGTGLLARTLAGLSRAPRVLVSASAVGVYGSRGDTVLTEADSPGTGFLANVVQAWEAAAEPARQAGIRVVHPRMGVVIDPAGGMLQRVRLPFSLGLAARLGSGRQWVSWVSLRDTLAGIRLLLERPDLDGPINLTSPVPVTNAELTDALAKVLHRPVLLSVPAPLLRFFLRDLAREALLASTRVVPARLLESGYQFRDPDLFPALVHMLEHQSGEARD